MSLMTGPPSPDRRPAGAPAQLSSTSPSRLAAGLLEACHRGADHGGDGVEEAAQLERLFEHAVVRDAELRAAVGRYARHEGERHAREQGVDLRRELPRLTGALDHEIADDAIGASALALEGARARHII